MYGNELKIDDSKLQSTDWGRSRGSEFQNSWFGEDGTVKHEVEGKFIGPIYKADGAMDTSCYALGEPM